MSKGGRVHNPRPDLHSTSYFAALPPPGDAGARHTVKIFHNRLIEKESSLQTTRVDLDPAVERKRPAPEPAAREVPASQPSPHPPAIEVEPEPAPVQRDDRPGRGDGLPKHRRKTKEGELPVPGAEYPTAAQLYRRIPQDIRRTYKAEASFHNVFFLLVKEEWLDDWTAGKFKQIDKACNSMVKDIPRLKGLDFSPLLQHPADWAEQVEISDHHVRMMDACFVHYGGDIGLVLRYLGGGVYGGMARRE